MLTSDSCGLLRSGTGVWRAVGNGEKRRYRRSGFGPAPGKGTCPETPRATPLPCGTANPRVGLPVQLAWSGLLMEGVIAKPLSPSGRPSARSADAYQNPVWGTLGALVRAGEVAKSLAGCSCNCADKKGRKQREYLHSDVRVDLPEAFGVNFQVLRLCPEPYGRLSVLTTSQFLNAPAAR